MSEEELTIAVKVIQTQGRSALVQWGPEEDPRRAWAPAYKVEDGRIGAETLGECPLYGIQWEQYLQESALSESTIETVSRALRKAGIWTFEDLQSNDRAINRIAVNIIGKAVWGAAKRAAAKGERKNG